MKGITMGLQAVAVVTAIALAAAVVLWVGATRWEASTESLRAGLLHARQPIAPATFTAAELNGLPAPVQRYFRAALREGQPIIAVARFTHEGTFNLGTSKPDWRAFTSTQVVVTRRPGFVWDARVRMLPGVDACVHDAYVAGAGLLEARLLGLVKLVDLRDTPEVAQGELMRYLAEAPWYPTALLPSQGVRWEAVDDATARATLVDGPTSVSLEFRFGPNGLIESAQAASRARTVDGASVDTPWRTRVIRETVRAGMRIPADGEVAWLLADGPLPYWRGRLIDIAYEFAP